MSETFGARLRRLRIAAGFSQPELARRSGQSQTNISRMELDQMKRPSIEATEALATALGVSFEVMRGTETGTVATTAKPALAIVSEATPLEEAIWRAIDPSKHTSAEADAARRVGAEVRNYLKPDVDVTELARRIVDATHAVYKSGEPLSSPLIWLRVSTAGSLGAAEARTASNARMNAEADADLEAEGFDAEHRARAATAVKARLAAQKGRAGDP